MMHIFSHQGFCVYEALAHLCMITCILTARRPVYNESFHCCNDKPSPIRLGSCVLCVAGPRFESCEALPRVCMTHGKNQLKKQFYRKTILYKNI